jgi:hypothetical protein
MRCQGLYSKNFIFFVNYKWAQYAGVLQYTRVERHAKDKHSSLLGPFVSYDEILNTAPGTVFKTLHFLHKLQMGTIRQCYITLGRKGLPETNTPAYWAHS